MDKIEIKVTREEKLLLNELAHFNQMPVDHMVKDIVFDYLGAELEGGQEDFFELVDEARPYYTKDEMRGLLRLV